jgi:hypothetical protein
MRKAGLATLLALAVACSSNGNGVHHSCPQQGIMLLSWTLGGQAVTPQTCSSIDHMTLTMDTNCGRISIDPIPCIQGAHWEYDGLPEGPVGIVLDAVDARGVVKAEGFAETTLTMQKPPVPAPVDLN